ncbi:MAG TPA: hypothetical protein VL402_12645 [Xanthobacteraceae bacterium]|jgi:hypothetical protein|nr:hypothetical protein [Xanthobacteraceae bacterium]
MSKKSTLGCDPEGDYRFCSTLAAFKATERRGFFASGVFLRANDFADPLAGMRARRCRAKARLSATIINCANCTN